jgi:hypothetical protein
MKPTYHLIASILIAFPSFLRTLSAADFPEFIVPGYDIEMQALNDLHQLHHDAAFSNCTLWDPWLPMSTLWVSESKRTQIRSSLLSRRIDQEGYVSMQQHRGMAHSEGWPFPAWQQSTGKGFHFAIADEVWAIQAFNLKPLANTEGWFIEGAEVLGIDPIAGLKLRATSEIVTITTPPFRCGTIVAPFARIEWATRNLKAQSQASIQWQLEGETIWPDGRTVTVVPPAEMQFVNVPLYRQPSYSGLLTQYRLRLDHAAGAEIDLKSILTAIDTRHPITNPNFLRGCYDYFCWTGDLEFLRLNIGRMRQALKFAIQEFGVRDGKHVYVPWVGHDGRSGLVIAADGKKTARPGLGVGNNYYDLVPFGGHDGLATLYLYDALRLMAELETSIQKHSEWSIPSDDNKLEIAEITTLAEEVKRDFQQRFWNGSTERFLGWIDSQGQAYDFGFTFLNLEAIYLGLPSDGQTKRIFDWLDGRREVTEDTSRGTDIYHWRFAPRTTTRRNIDTYVWPWTSPESIPWGGQIQDGGAVLGFSYHDIMARLKSNGPDDAWKRLSEITTWFREVRSEGGYRAYYAKPGRGTLQGGGTAGGLGLDQEFLESVLLPQVMLYGFLGFKPTPDGYELHPRLPKEWPSLTINRIHFRESMLDITAHADGKISVKTSQRKR